MGRQCRAPAPVITVGQAKLYPVVSFLLTKLTSRRPRQIAGCSVPRDRRPWTYRQIDHADPDRLSTGCRSVQSLFGERYSLGCSLPAVVTISRQLPGFDGRGGHPRSLPPPRPPFLMSPTPASSTRQRGNPTATALCLRPVGSNRCCYQTSATPACATAFRARCRVLDVLILHIIQDFSCSTLSALTPSYDWLFASVQNYSTAWGLIQFNSIPLYCEAVKSHGMPYLVAITAVMGCALSPNGLLFPVIVTFALIFLVYQNKIWQQSGTAPSAKGPH